MNLSRIVCAIDLSEIARPALDQARALAEWEGADLHIVHVGPNPQPLARAARRVALGDESGSQIPGAQFRVTSVVRSGDPVEAVVQYARSVDADLIVVGTALPLAGVSEREKIGEKIARNASCATLVVPLGVESARDDLPFRNIVCPVDFSPGNVPAFEEAVRLAQRAGGVLTLVHVLEEFNDAPTVVRCVVPKYRRLREAEAYERLWASIPHEALNWAHIDVRVSVGDAGELITALADELRADLIVMGVMTRTRSSRLLFGSTTHRVTIASACPVLVVRTPTSAEAWDPEYLAQLQQPQGESGAYSAFAHLAPSLSEQRHRRAS